MLEKIEKYLPENCGNNNSRYLTQQEKKFQTKRLVNIAVRLMDSDLC